MLPGYALIHSIKRGQLDEMMLAIAAGANLNHRDFDGKTPLEVALDRGQFAIARRLVSLGADVNQKIGKRGEVLLHRAARTGNIGVLTLLLESGANLEPIGSAGKVWMISTEELVSYLNTGLRPPSHLMSQPHEWRNNECQKLNHA